VFASQEEQIVSVAREARAVYLNQVVAAVIPNLHIYDYWLAYRNVAHLALHMVLVAEVVPIHLL